MHTYNAKMDGTKILLAAHRGNQEAYPENTLIAMESALNHGCDMIETDIHMTKDGYLVLLHDTDVARTTNGSGSINEMTLQEVKALDAGSWKNPAFAGTKIPTVEEFLELVYQTDVLVNWELKDYPKDVGEAKAYECVDKLVELIDKFNMSEKSMMNSFSAKILQYIAEKYKGKFVIHGQGIHTCCMYNDVAEKEPESYLDWVCMYNRSQENPAGLEIDYAYAKAHDIIPCICFLDIEENYQLAIDMGCRMFTSNNPQKGIEILKKLGYR